MSLLVLEIDLRVPATRPAWPWLNLLPSCSPSLLFLRSCGPGAEATALLPTCPGRILQWGCCRATAARTICLGSIVRMITLAGVGWAGRVSSFFFFFLPVLPIPGCRKYSSEFCIYEGKTLFKWVWEGNLLGCIATLLYVLQAVCCRRRKSNFVTVIDTDDNAMLVCFSYVEQWEQKKM